MARFHAKAGAAAAACLALSLFAGRGLLAASGASVPGPALPPDGAPRAAPASGAAAPLPSPREPVPGPATAEALSLDGAIRYALTHNPRVAGAAAEVREARARVSQRRAVRFPQTGVNNFVFRQGPVVPGFGGGPPAFPPYRYNVGVFLSQVLLDWGERSARQRAAEREADAAGFRLAETENDVRLVVAVAFYNVLRGRELGAVARERRAAAREQLRVARARFESNVAPRFDMIRSEAELANAEQELIAARNELALAEAAFNTALGRDVLTAVELRPPVPGPAPPVSFEAAREAALQRRPRLAALRESLRGSREEVRARRAENKPRVNLGGAYDRPNPGGFASQDFRYNVGLVMTFPFFDSGLTRGRVREAEADLEAGRQLLEEARQQVELEVRSAQLDRAEALQRIETAREEQRAAREALRVAQVRYGAGVGTTLEVTDAQVAVARAGQNLANAEFDYQTARARLESAVGAPLETLAAPAAAP